MKLLAGSFIALWSSTVLMKLACFIKLVRLRIASSYPAFSIFLLIGSAQSAIRIHAGMVGGSVGYEKTWLAGQWITLLLMGMLTAECVWLHAKHFPGIRNLALVSSSVILTISMLGCLATASVGIPISPDAPVLVLFTRYMSTTCFAIVSITAVCFRAFGHDSIRPNVHRHTAILQGYFFCQALAFFVRYGTEGTGVYQVVHAFIATGGGAICLLLWHGAFTAAGERWNPPAPGERLSDIIAREKSHKDKHLSAGR